MRSIEERLKDIQQAIMDIEKYTNQGRHAFDEDQLVESWIIRQMEIIGEAVRHLPDDFKRRYSHIPWKQIAGMRDMLIHHYFIVDKEIVWLSIEQDLPVLKAVITAGLEDETG